MENGKTDIEELRSWINCLPDNADERQIYKILVRFVSGLGQREMRKCPGRRVNYITMEVLPGRMLVYSLKSYGIYGEVCEIISGKGISPDRVFLLDRDIPLGSGGLGRLAASYTEAMSDAGIGGVCHTLLYKSGYFAQKIRDGGQIESEQSWGFGLLEMTLPSYDEAVEVSFFGRVEEKFDSDGRLSVRYSGDRKVRAVPFDIPVVGASGVSAKIRAYKSEYDAPADNSRENAVLAAITGSLYPDDSTEDGKTVRLAQEYFLASAAVQTALKHHLRDGGSVENFSDANVLHINDCHPALAVPELFRILMDGYGLGWEEAEDTVRRCFSYTNHTVMPEALGKIEMSRIKLLLPRIYSIVFECDRRTKQEMRSKGALPQLIDGAGIIRSDVMRGVNLAALYSEKVNGVSSMHTEILKDRVLYSVDRIYPRKIIGITNGISPSRWLGLANPELVGLISEAIGEGFIKEPEKLAVLDRFSADSEFQKRFMLIRRNCKARLCRYAEEVCAVTPVPDSMFVMHIKRIHEYKRQLLSALKIISLILDLENGAKNLPMTFFFAGKAAPGYDRAKETIRLLTALSRECKFNPKIKGKITVCFIPDYSVSVAEIIVPATDISEQISLAGTEASGTGNMKMMMNGALTVGTRDGANPEIFNAAGKRGVVFFGYDRFGVEIIKKSVYSPEKIIAKSDRLLRIIKRLEEGIGGEKFRNLAEYLRKNDPYLCIADFDSYMEAEEKAQSIYGDENAYAETALHLIAGSRFFFSERSVREYENRMWK